MKTIDGLKIIEALKPVTFQWKEGFNDGKYEGDGKKHFGFIAQDLVEIFGDEYGIVQEREGYLSVNYHELIPILVKVIQNLNKRVEELENA